MASPEASVSSSHLTPPTAWTNDDVVHLMEGEHGEAATMSTLASTSEPPVMRPAASLAKKRSKEGRKKSMLNLFQQPAPEAMEATKKIVPKLQTIYKDKILPLEREYSLHSFCLPTKHELREAEFEARPMVLLLGPYSTGKTSFIRYLLGRDFPGIHIGPEPTTDKFTALVYGSEDGVSDDVEDEYLDEFSEDEDAAPSGKIIKGNTLTVTPELPFASLSSFGSAFLNHFHGSVSSSPLLRHLTIIDTPGVLSGEKQRLSRDYDYAEAAKWFADRSDLILLLFDAHKLDMSDELKEVVETIRPHNDDKIRCVLNKCDSVEREQLVRVYGSLMWSMGKLFRSPEVARVYTGSYWAQPLVHDDFQKMFEKDEKLLMHELVNLSSTCAERKVNAMVKRIRLVKLHLCVLGYLSQKTPMWFGIARARTRLMENLEQVFDAVCKQYGLSRGDMPNPAEFRKRLEAFEDFSVFSVPDRATLQQLDSLIENDIPALMKGSGIVGKQSTSSPRGLRGATKKKLRFLYELGFSMPVHEEDGETTHRRSLIGKAVWVALFAVVVAVGYLWLARNGSVPDIWIPELKMPELKMPQLKVSSFVYIGGALAFLLLHFLLRTTGV